MKRILGLGVVVPLVTMQLLSLPAFADNGAESVGSLASVQSNSVPHVSIITAEMIQDQKERLLNKPQTESKPEEKHSEGYEKFKDYILQYQQSGDSSIHTFVDGKPASSDVKAFNQDGRTMLPLRGIGEALNAQVSFTNGVITIIKGITTVQLTVDRNTAIINGQPVQIDQPPIVVDGRTFIPVRFISQQLEASVDYVPEGNIVDISDLAETKLIPESK